MRILVDCRPALHERTGVGDYIHHPAHAYAAARIPQGCADAVARHEHDITT
jgi:hypothetical protein